MSFENSPSATWTVLSYGWRYATTEEGLAAMWELLGLSDTDEIVYRHDVALPGTKISLASDFGALSSATVKSSRARLIDTGLLRLETMGEVRAVPSAPGSITDRLRGQLDADYAQKRSELAIFQAEMTRLVNQQLFATSGPHEPRPRVARLPGDDAAVVKIIELMCGAAREVVQVERAASGPNPSGTDGVHAAELGALGRGVRIRTLYPPAELADAQVRRRAEATIRAGASLRATANSVAIGRLFVFDRSIAVVIDNCGHPSEAPLLVSETALVRLLGNLFDTWWAHGRDVDLLLADSEEVNPEEKIMLWLLSDGMKDESIAKQLGISVRSVRRKISDVLQRLSAHSRFQAGVLATQRGWI